MEKQLKALDESIKHWEKMVGYAEWMPTDKHWDIDSFEHKGRKGPLAKYCALCVLSNNTCTDCILGKEKGSCSSSNKRNLYYWVITSITWGMFYNRGLAFIEQLKIIQREYQLKNEMVKEPTIQKHHFKYDGMTAFEKIKIEQKAKEKEIEILKEELNRLKSSIECMEKIKISDVILYGSKEGIKEALNKTDTNRIIALATAIHGVLYKRLEKY